MATRRARGLGAGFRFRLAFQLIRNAGATGGGQIGSDRGLPQPGRSLEARQQLVVEPEAGLVVRVAVFGELDDGAQNLSRGQTVEAGPLLQEPADEQAGPGKQDHRQHELEHDQSARKEAAAFRPGIARTFLQRRVQVDAGGL